MDPAPVQNRIFLNHLRIVAVTFMILLQLFFISLFPGPKNMIYGKTLFIIAQPGDEIEFFMPGIFQSAEPHIFSLSAGDKSYDNASSQYERFLSSCRNFGFNVDCSLELDSALDISSVENWSRKDVLEIVRGKVEEIQPDRIITFGPGFGEFTNNKHYDEMVAPFLQFRWPVGSMPLTVLSDLSLKYNNKTYANKTSANEKANDFDIPVFFLLRGPKYLNYFGPYSALLYNVLEKDNRGFYAQFMAYDFLSSKIYDSLKKYSKQKSSFSVYMHFFLNRFTYFNHLAPQTITQL